MSDGQRRRLLVVSDMHLGRDCKEITGFERAARPDSAFDQAFIDMLAHYTAGREHEWRLVLAGDFIDFVEVVVVPDAHGPLKLRLTFEVTEEEREYGLGSESERSLVKLERTFEYHRALFRHVAGFVRSGGEVVIIRGNHDAELHWKKVQRVFRRMIAEIAFEGAKLEVDELLDLRNDFQSRISFAPWVYIEPGRIFIEHGHQYDAYCSFDHQLYPVSPTNPRRIDTPVFAFAMRYFVNRMQDFAAHNADIWNVKDYAAWLKQKGVAGTLFTARMGLGAGVRMLIYAARFTAGRVRRYGKEHNKNLVEEAAKYSVPADKLGQIDALHHVPVSRNLPELMRLLFLDRILLALGALALTFLVLLVVRDAWFELIGVVLVGGLAAWLNRKLAPRRYLLPGPKQAQAAKRIAELLDVPLVVMGHSHTRRISDLGKGRKYVNTGCWLPPISGNEHVDANAACSCRLTHLVVDEDFELRVFCRVTRTVRIADIDETKVQAGDQDSDVLPTPDAVAS